ncbi:Histidine phosphatase superfamily (branch 1) [Fictibacillus solisalsi]|uniref:Histidine phosphatase superfamily (Branch 1) n=1 Tax=Fictibacillus solisalsi TaxID=459525 RepID=A0A1H0A275_9BACL|nr:histidine phosphatase family protein [Fictibacillus solisalsi]SDN27819.1 Histidine phosphatase superfamily (branch 1) [Fictibacillus solisalsi]
MRIGLMRHFKVTRGYPSGLFSSQDLLKWVDEYDASEVEESEVELGGVDWKTCYSSNLSRAEITARRVFKGEITFLDELREIKLSPFFRSNIRLPLPVHLLFIRMAWLMKHPSQNPGKQEVLQQISNTVDRITAHQEDDVLIVCHGGVMMFMRKELLKRGYKGPQLGRHIEHGKVYVFEN